MDNDDCITELIESAHKTAKSLEQTRRARDCLFCGGDDNLIFDEFLDDYVCVSCRLKLSKPSLPTTDLRIITHPHQHSSDYDNPQRCISCHEGHKIFSKEEPTETFITSHATH